MILVSACLLGHKVKYSGGANPHELLMRYNERGRFIAICPECFAMLPCPRPAMEIQGGTGKKVLINGGDVYLDAYCKSGGSWNDIRIPSCERRNHTKAKDRA